MVEGGRYLSINDTITLVDLERTPPKPYPLILPILFEDDFIAIIHKPAGISVSGNYYKTIQNALVYNIAPSIQNDALPWALPVHRLDHQTQGLLIVAKTKTARIELGKAFENKTIVKTYQAIVIGDTLEEGSINFDVDNKPSLTTYKRLKSVPSLKSGTLTLLELYPKTGRTHQIRIHCSKSGFPILGDKLYGKPHLILKGKGLFLVATALKFHHPITKAYLSFNIPTPYKFIKRLNNEIKRFEVYQ